MARELRFWLKNVVQAAEPWMSERDMDAGVRWTPELLEQLQQASFGVVCVTRENLNSNWLTFEAGALTSRLDGGRVVPVLLDLPPSALPFPLAIFQAVSVDRDGIFSLIRSVNRALDDRKMPGENLAAVFDALWPSLAGALASPPNDVDDGSTPGGPGLEADTLHEILGAVRALRRDLAQPRTPGFVTAESHDYLDWDDHFMQGVELANRRSRETDLGALRAYNEAIALVPPSIDENRRARLFGYRGAILKRLDRIQEAMNDILVAEGLAQNPYEVGDVKYNKAGILAMSGRAAEAISTLRELFELDPKWRDAVRVREQAYFRNLSTNPEFRALFA